MRVTLLLLPLLGVVTGDSKIKGESLLHPSWGQRLPPKKANSADLNLKTQEKPFLPFSDLGAPAGPIRGDGTFKDRAPEDTLPSRLSDPYTTLDKIKKKGPKQGLKKESLKKMKGALGGLNPEEVFYADEDMIIIKGGGFHGEPYKNPHRAKVRKGFFFPTLPFRGAPSPSAEYNGNTPTILPAPPAAASRFATLSIFFPSSAVPNTAAPTPFITGGSPKEVGTSHRYVYVIIPQLYTTPNEEHLPNTIRPKVEIQDPTTRQRPSSQPVLQEPPSFKPPLIFPLQTPPSEPPKLAPPSQQPSQKLISPAKPNLPFAPFAEKLPPQATVSTTASPSVHLQPEPTPQVPPNSMEVEVVSIGHSLADDTKVNELQPRPPINPDAEIISVGGPESRETFEGGAQQPFRRPTNSNPLFRRIPK